MDHGSLGSKENEKVEPEHNIPIEEDKPVEIKPLPVEEKPIEIKPMSTHSVDEKPVDIPPVMSTTPPSVEIPTIVTTPAAPVEMPSSTVPPVVEEIKTTTAVPIQESNPFEKIVDIPPPVADKPVEHPEDPSSHKSVLLEESNLFNDISNDGFCTSDDCLKYTSENEDGFIAKHVKPLVKSIAISIKSMSPYPVNQFDDTGVFVMIFLIFTFIIYFINWLFQDGGKKDVIDRRALHDALTKIKEQEAQIQHLSKNVADPQVMAQYSQQINRSREEFTMLKQQYDKVVHS